MKHVMVDLETLSTAPNAAIMSIGAVAFDPETGRVGAEFYVNIDPKSAQDAGLHVDAGTVSWWFSQSNEARAHLVAPKPLPLQAALAAFQQFLMLEVEPKFTIWGNGASFDNVILSHAYEASGSPAPWRYWQDACYRTMKGLFPQVKMVREGVHHDALADARSQAKHLCAIFTAMRQRGVAGVA